MDCGRQDLGFTDVLTRPSRRGKHSRPSATACRRLLRTDPRPTTRVPPRNGSVAGHFRLEGAVPIELVAGAGAGLELKRVEQLAKISRDVRRISQDVTQRRGKTTSASDCHLNLPRRFSSIGRAE
jgi:hypothetical protein